VVEFFERTGDVPSSRWHIRAEQANYFSSGRNSGFLLIGGQVAANVLEVYISVLEGPALTAQAPRPPIQLIVSQF